MKSASALERAAAIDTVVFDKTGRRTLGAPRLLGDGIDPAVLREAAELAARSRHPLCRALLAACPDAEPAGDVEDMPAAGLRRRTTAGERPEEQKSELQARMRLSDAVFSFKKINSHL